MWVKLQLILKAAPMLRLYRVEPLAAVLLLDCTSEGGVKSAITERPGKDCK